MSETAHTPGPWSFKKAKFPVDGHFDFGISAIVNGKSACISEAFGRVAEDAFLDAEANARLIAAAPELSDLARNVAGFDDLLLVSSDLNVLRNTLREYRDQARAAITKVECRS